jgi:hypothetical protein
VDNQIKPTKNRRNFEESWSEQCRENEATLYALQSRMQEALAAKGCVAGSPGSYESKEPNLDSLEAPVKALPSSRYAIKEFQNQELLEISA